jgi:hypothetical protein
LRSCALRPNLASSRSYNSISRRPIPAFLNAKASGRTDHFLLLRTWGLPPDQGCPLDGSQIDFFWRDVTTRRCRRIGLKGSGGVGPLWHQSRAVSVRIKRNRRCASNPLLDCTCLATLTHRRDGRTTPVASRGSGLTPPVVRQLAVSGDVVARRSRHLNT